MNFDNYFLEPSDVILELNVDGNDNEYSKKSINENTKNIKNRDITIDVDLNENIQNSLVAAENNSRMQQNLAFNGTNQECNGQDCFAENVR